ncbi:substrate-binding domain-containing protein [Vibrio sp. S9_S30]|uniref:substrate-binding domain-containing protein n=1 Tax=Vibrio sp. S9_S30 TaxID=2720226 RepID=UPI00168077F3|nr:substrate-binding domain-containing protein [Vibrio sp. S9_S30]MBD1557218.1 substrate-binding domain-containing protein [Vibrio sp. S9_S30]
MATIKDVARAAGVSVATVSRVINRSPKASTKAIESVNLAMAQLGYRPNANARALVSQSTNTMGVLVSDVSDPFFGTLIKAVDDVAHTKGKHLLIGNGYHNANEEREAIELLVNSRCESLVIHAKGLSDKELLSYTQEVRGMVLINRHIPEIAHRCIALDNYKGAYLATEYLIRHGHTNIACISSSHHIEDVDARIAGYLAALKDHNIVLSDKYIVHRNPNGEGGEEAMTHLLTQSLPITAVFAYNDYMAAGAMSILDENGLDVPENVSVIGFDDGPIARYLTPKLTTIRYPIQMMAEQAAQLALALANGEAVHVEPVMLSPTLVRRNSVDKVRKE